MSVNPYPTRPGFSARVAFAANALRLCGEGRDERIDRSTGEVFSRVHSREMDNCFEMDDGEAVVWALMDKAKDDPVLMRGIERMCGNARALDHWRKVGAYAGPQLTLKL
ncbi:hypothetical protein [Roseicella sp. DB1501]|uniref:hypothetical protein n=1 Tax=Roseicella sp. DB1501 TaxID=2730925 RepID=UPI001492FF8A|nr:hypothetical protein [Roseicella sp. DB1501]NOG70458.1 hypothetical protein [Roseicella sp. DB1501]